MRPKLHLTLCTSRSPTKSHCHQTSLSVPFTRSYYTIKMAAVDRLDISICQTKPPESNREREFESQGNVNAQDSFPSASSPVPLRKHSTAVSLNHRDLRPAIGYLVSAYAPLRLQTARGFDGALGCARRGQVRCRRVAHVSER